MRQDVSLKDRFDLTKSPVLLNGTQALVRLMLLQKARDRAAGLTTAGYVCGYRGSPLGAVDMQFSAASEHLTANDIRFQFGLNEDLAATAVWGTQQAHLRGEGRFDGVFGLWYGKGPGVDRSGDVMRHANMAGTAPLGGVLMALGDDHTGESSTSLHQSDFALVDAYMPVLSPAGVQEIIDFGLYGYALSRFSGLWAGLKLMKDTVEATAVVDGIRSDLTFAAPEIALPPGGLHIRLVDDRVAQEARLIDHKRFAAEAFARANGIDKRVFGRPGAKIGFVAAGKNWLDLTHALDLLGIDAEMAERLGLTTYKIGQTWPLDMHSFHDWAEGLDLIVVVEEKRKLLEVQIKEAIFDDRRGRRVYGWKDGTGAELFPVRWALDPVMIAEKIGAILIEEDRGIDRLKAALAALDRARQADNAEDIAARLPYFCSGCPHNTSTKVPDGARAYAGIGCHFMVQWMDRETLGFTHMGGEGANWVGEAPFSTRDHVFQNMGDGTYNHSGVQSIRFALMSDANVTFKILYNDAVAMTGGQGNDGGLSAAQIAHEVVAMGVRNLAIVYDEKEDLDLAAFPAGLPTHERADMDAVQTRMSETKGVSVILYVQTCAAEKRRRRKRNLFPDPDKRVFINTDICEGCGDCGVQSNCVSIVPVETELGRKRAIDQSSCNKDFSCVKGFCPSFVTIEGAKIRKDPTQSVAVGELPDPVLPKLQGSTHNVVITGVGGTGVVTIGAVLAMAAHVDGKAAGMMEMAGLAQKGGAVYIHVRLAETPEDIAAIRVATGECHTLIGGDLVVSAGAKTLGLLAPDRAAGVVNSHEIITGEFTRNTDFQLPSDQLQVALQARLQERLAMFDASDLAKRLLGDTIFSNMMICGAAWQLGLLPLSGEAIRRAIELNGAAVEKNLQAFEYGRWAALHPDEVARLLTPNVVALPTTREARIAYREQHLTAYQSKRLARRYRKAVDQFDDPDLQEAVALGYHKLLAYKDEYEVARLLIQSEDKARAAFEGDLKLTYHLAPPLLSKIGADGRPQKRPFRATWMFKLLARFKWLRGTPFDPFGYTAERRMERRLIAEFEADLPALKAASNREAALALAELPLQIKGFGPVKEANAASVEARRKHLRAELSQPAPQTMAAE